MTKSRSFFAFMLVLTLGYGQFTQACEPDPEEPYKPRPANHFQPSSQNSLETFQQFEELPDEIKVMIFGSLRLEDFINLPFVCHKWQKFINSQGIVRSISTEQHYNTSFIRKAHALEILRRYTNDLKFSDNISYDFIVNIAQDKDIPPLLFVRYMERFEAPNIIHLKEKLINGINVFIPEFEAIIPFNEASLKLSQWYPCATILKALNSQNALNCLHRSVVKLHSYWKSKFDNNEYPTDEMIEELAILKLVENVEDLKRSAILLNMLKRKNEALIIYELALNSPQLARLQKKQINDFKRLYGIALIAAERYLEALKVFEEIYDKRNIEYIKALLMHQSK